MTMHPRIYFDTNEGTHDHGYWLSLPQSEADLQALGAKLQEGLIVTIFMLDELEMQATLRFNRSDGMWLADPIAGTIIYLDRS